MLGLGIVLRVRVNVRLGVWLGKEVWLGLCVRG